MGIFKRRIKEDIQIQPLINSRVEVELHKSATVQAAEKAKLANKHLNDLLIENGFTLKIYLAAGGRLPTKNSKEMGH